MPLISVIIPAYNNEKTIRETIESVLKQTFYDFELIVINDGSSDRTLEIATDIKDLRIKVFSYINAGGAVSRNRGFSHSVGEFIAFLDADDLWTPDKLEAQLKALQKNPHAAVAYSWLDAIDESGKFLRKGNHITEKGDIFAKLFLIPFVESGSNPLIRRQAFIDIGGFDESLTASQDYDLYLRLAARYEFIAVPIPQILYRISSNSMSANVRRQEVTSLFVRERAFQESPKPLPPELKRDSITNFYKDTIFKLLNMPPHRERGWQAARLLCNALKYEPELLQRRIIWKVLLRIAAITILPSQQAEIFLNKMNKLADINTLYIFMRREP
ncbi:glycosyltransferase [Phormidium sp. LEGE 05292]|uniref:glycosyltransferase n=1 Tax=[Phormidium] sp. LEGE 05292 TaxID=767427 RepID=UPI00187F6C91|nr:glycosyltransferase [Phormidium sp. LEGE 05292]MBE9228368.1 glycosyltransferase [Phormidium sp. LEGE 05292]